MTMRGLAFVAGIATLGLACTARDTSVGPANPGAFRAPADRTVGEWIELGGGTVGGLSQSHVVATQRPIETLLVQAVDGAPEIEVIQIHYRDGQTRRVRLQRTLPADDGQVIELRERRPISRIVVFTDPDSSGEYVLFGA
jgi:hypothetical protein